MRSIEPERKAMNRFGTFASAAIALPFLVLVLLAGDAAGQQKTLKEQLIGTWTYVSVDIVHSDGSRLPLFGPNPSGLASFDANGRYLLLTARMDLPKFASNNRNGGTAEEIELLCKDQSLTSARTPSMRRIRPLHSTYRRAPFPIGMASSRSAHLRLQQPS